MKTISFFWKHAGLVSVFWNGWAVHLGILKREHWFWGREVEEYDSIVTYYGLGPLGFVVKPTCIFKNWNKKKTGRGRTNR